MQSLSDRMAAIPHRRLDLAPLADGEDRPLLACWAGVDDGLATAILSIGALHGRQNRYLELTPKEARRLANILLKTADDIDHKRGQLAADEAKAEGASVIDQVRAQITACFSGA